MEWFLYDIGLRRERVNSFFTSSFSRHGRECAKVSMPTHQVLLLIGPIFKASYNTLITWVIKILSMDQLDLGNI